MCRLLYEAGFQAYFVGGCVRNSLLHQPVDDVDIATDARPEVVMSLAERPGFKAVPTGIEHGTVTIVVDSRSYEVTTFRRDVETYGRHATVTFSSNIEDDARRRDFTMNALYARADGSVIDPLGGLEDLRERHVRFIEDPCRRIREDYLRILRFFRFHAWYGDPADGLDPAGMAAVASNLDGLEWLSRERIGHEVTKLLGAPDPTQAVAAMCSVGVLAAILVGATDSSLPSLVRLEQESGVAPDALRRLAVLGCNSASTALRFSRKQARRLQRLAGASSNTMTPEELGYRYGVRDGCDMILIRAAMQGVPPLPDFKESLHAGDAAVFPVEARDLMPQYAGQALGTQLGKLENIWIDSGFSLSRKELLDQVS
ncbi:MAG: CCA tRNA nucleotidyltransferase [Roseovarius sp.]|nr:CCA tRNA nucleotidyltransferase [Roseovarius sp.]